MRSFSLLLVQRNCSIDSTSTEDDGPSSSWRDKVMEIFFYSWMREKKFTSESRVGGGEEGYS